MQNDLISRSELLKEAAADGAYGYLDTKQIAAAPAVDAVEVVRCKDCIYYETGKDYLPYCNHPDSGIAYFPEEDDFCSYGERRDDDGQMKYG